MGNEAFQAALSYAIDRGEINSDSPIYQDIRLIYDQIERCKAIISDMGSLGKDDQYVKTIDLFTLLFEAIQQ